MHTSHAGAQPRRLHAPCGCCFPGPAATPAQVGLCVASPVRRLGLTGRATPATPPGRCQASSRARTERSRPVPRARDMRPTRTQCARHTALTSARGEPRRFEQAHRTPASSPRCTRNRAYAPAHALVLRPRRPAFRAASVGFLPDSQATTVPTDGRVRAKKHDVQITSVRRATYTTIWFDARPAAIWPSVDFRKHSLPGPRRLHAQYGPCAGVRSVSQKHRRRRRCFPYATPPTRKRFSPRGARARRAAIATHHAPSGYALRLRPRAGNRSRIAQDCARGI